ncbi:hypothetical protein KOR42_17080 [Thalassoglobus neptunius]|uniref:Uncharacterized protein n=2 Tax=Thalassoglobus neptunius TaxID=1938619 RepID=A0A5C5X5Y8_9PLAN|nr:hypothetical protein KOR42_17080 [Thalassoglobus neptunius]
MFNSFDSDDASSDAYEFIIPVDARVHGKLKTLHKFFNCEVIGKSRKDVRAGLVAKWNGTQFQVLTELGDFLGCFEPLSIVVGKTINGVRLARIGSGDGVVTDLWYLDLPEKAGASSERFDSFEVKGDEFLLDFFDRFSGLSNGALSFSSRNDTIVRVDTSLLPNISEFEGFASWDGATILAFAYNADLLIYRDRRIAWMDFDQGVFVEVKGSFEQFLGQYLSNVVGGVLAITADSADGIE